MYYDGFHRSFCDTDDLETVHESDCIFAFETPEIFRPEGILSQRGKWASVSLIPPGFAGLTTVYSFSLLYDGIIFWNCGEIHLTYLFMMVSILGNIFPSKKVILEKNFVPGLRFFSS